MAWKIKRLYRSLTLLRSVRTGCTLLSVSSVINKRAGRTTSTHGHHLFWPEDRTIKRDCIKITSDIFLNEFGLLLRGIKFKLEISFILWWIYNGLMNIKQWYCQIKELACVIFLTFYLNFMWMLHWKEMSYQSLKTFFLLIVLLKVLISE